MNDLRCWQCGREVDADEAVRETVLLALRVDLCPECAGQIRRQRRQMFWAGLFGLAVSVALVGGYLLSLR